MPRWLQHRITGLMLLSGGVTAALYLLLVQDRLRIDSRVLEALWDLAHVPLFFLLTLCADFAFSARKRRRFRLWLLTLCPPLVLMAGLTEFLQSFTSREASVSDALMNVAGIALAGLCVYGLRHARGRRRALALSLAGVASLGLVSGPAALALADRQLINDFPLLFSGARFADRFAWSRGELQSTEQAAYLRVTLLPQRYSGTTLKHFPPDWSSRQTLVLQLRNPDATALPMVIRIHDRIHETGAQAHNDRFNRDVLLLPGDNTLRFPLQQIAQAPAQRDMDLTQIRMLRLFYAGTPPVARDLHITGVWLE